MEKLLLYHTGHHELRQPDVRYGRKNADFGQGFYLSPDGGFAGRWAREQRGETIYVNAYELTLDGLRVLRLERDEEWYEYIFRNRAGYADRHAEQDVIIGPIANDTIYNTYGILTSGILEKAQALRLLQVGPAYEQVAVKTERAAAQLRWLSARIPDSAETVSFRELFRREEAAYQQSLAALFETL